jgi:mono/diheme cytochrome c family protein
MADSVYGNAKDSLIEPSDSLLAVQEKIAEGKNLYKGKCGRCHELHDPKEYKLKSWKDNLVEMKDKAELTKKEYDKILAYLAANCRK